MKKYTSFFGVMAVLIVVACSAVAVPRGINLRNTLLTGQVVRREGTVVTLDLGELAPIQTPETAWTASVLPTDVTGTVRLSGHTAPGGQTAAGKWQSFISFQRNTILDLDAAECFAVGENGQIETCSSQQISPMDVLTVVIGEDNTPARVMVLSGVVPSSADPETLQGTAACVIEANEDSDKEEYGSSGADENALRITAARVSLRDVRVEKADGESTDFLASSRYGMNAALLVNGGAQLTLSKSVVNSSAVGGSGVFGYGAGTSVHVQGGTVTTTADQSAGLQTAGGAGMQARNVTVITAGDSSAVLRAENGSLMIDGGTYTSGGYDSPAIYAAGTVSARNAELTANNSRAVFLQGRGSLSLENCDLSGNMNPDSGQTQSFVSTVMINGQDSPMGEEGSFSMKGGNLFSRSGDVFCIEDADCLISLDRVNIEKTEDGALLRVVANREEPGSSVVLTASRQTLSGDLVLEGNAALQLELQQASRWYGTVEQTADGAEQGTIAVHISRGCTWSLTGDSTVTSLDNEGTIEYNGFSITLEDGTVLTS